VAAPVGKAPYRAELSAALLVEILRGHHDVSFFFYNFVFVQLGMTVFRLPHPAAASRTR
jgi:hypothetical protein